ncbi:vanadium-dependent haloperoxidase [Streptomyces sp. NPDC001652]|uniref:vanadium-dependent haloperoxidase n=1 Tax=Streptomyces sp. NPDC001652 TaxID=3154393 RepID=UPI00332468C1
MTTSGRSPVSDFSSKRRSLLVGTASTAALATVGGTGKAAAADGKTETAQPATPAAGPAATATAAQPGFDLDKGNFYRDLLGAAGDSSGATQSIAPTDIPLILWIEDIMQTAWFDALAPYHPTAVGVHSRIARRPASEAATNRNKNIAALHAANVAVKALYPERAPIMRQVLAMVGLNADDDSTDTTTAVGIGNTAAKAVLESRMRDGMNFLGNQGRKYHGQPYEDYTGYEPVNTAYELSDPSRWQPALTTHRRRAGGGPGDQGVFAVQQFLTPHLGRVSAHTFRDAGRFKLARPGHTDHTDRAYRHAVDEILKASAGLTDEHKVKAEFFDNAYQGVLQSTKYAALAHNADLDLDGWIHLLFTSSVAKFDSLIAAWHHKREYDAVRPFSAVRHTYGNRPVTAWGGAGKGTVSDLPADEWTSYLPVSNHPDYPCGTTTVVAAEAQAARRFFGDDVLNWTVKAAAGSSVTEPGAVPAKDVELHYATWSDFEKDCARSRVWAGLHFRKTAERSLEFGTQFGDRAYEFVQRHINGDVED